MMAILMVDEEDAKKGRARSSTVGGGDRTRRFEARRASNRKNVPGRSVKDQLERVACA